PQRTSNENNWIPSLPLWKNRRLNSTHSWNAGVQYDCQPRPPRLHTGQEAQQRFVRPILWPDYSFRVKIILFRRWGAFHHESTGQRGPYTPEESRARYCAL